VTSTALTTSTMCLIKLTTITQTRRGFLAADRAVDILAEIAYLHRLVPFPP